MGSGYLGNRDKKRLLIPTVRPQRAKLNKVLKEEQIVFTELRGVRGQKRGKAGSNRAVLCNVQYTRLSLEERTLSPPSLLVLIALPVTFSAFLRAPEFPEVLKNYAAS